MQWIPRKVRLKKDPRFKDEEQPSRFAMITCGEKHTLLLAVNGAMWWAGEKSAVGLVDPNAVRKNKFEAKVESESFQYTFAPYFDPTSYGEFARMKLKFIASNFNSRTSFAIDEQNQVCEFGENLSFKKLDTEGKYVFAASGKKFQSLVHVERLPYTWGEVKNGKLGLEPDQLTALGGKSSSKTKKVKAPVEMAYFKQLREEAELDAALVK